ncbi:unnamed protein product [Closterium sp. NIES-65]|nr:unnamed protein product [Closterium sp. NIES-65]
MGVSAATGKPGRRAPGTSPALAAASPFDLSSSATPAPPLASLRAVPPQVPLAPRLPHQPTADKPLASAHSSRSLLSSQPYSKARRLPFRFPARAVSAQARALCHYAALTVAAALFHVVWIAFQSDAPRLPDARDPNGRAVPYRSHETLRGCPVCGRGEVKLPPLVRPLSARGAKMRLCMGSAAAPFAQGTFVSPEEARDGASFGSRFAQLAVFEAEALHEAADGAGDARGGGGKSGRQVQRGSAAVTTWVRLLAFLEDEESIRKTQWEGVAPALVVDTVVRHRHPWHIALECPLPPFPSPPSQSSSPPPADTSADPSADAAVPVHVRVSRREAWRHYVEYGQRLQVQLVAARNGSDLRMPPLLLCRADGDSDGDGGGGGSDGLPVDPGSRAPPFPFAAVEREVAAAANAGSGGGSELARLMGGDAGGVGGKARMKGAGKGEGAGASLAAFPMLPLARPSPYPAPSMPPSFPCPLLLSHAIPAPCSSGARLPFSSHAPLCRQFPEIYDQIISYEHCLMQGRRRGDRWQLHIDSDEFVWYEPRTGGFLKPLLARLELNHTRSRRAAARSPCGSVAIHTTTAPPESVATAPQDVLHVNHFTATAIDLAQHPCRSWVKPVLDQGLTWVTPRALKCRALPCHRSTPLECWLFCILPWQGEEDGRRGGAGGGGGLRVAKPENVESGEGEKSKEPAEDTM